MGGWDQVRSRLVGQDGRPMIYCFSNHADSVENDPQPSNTIQHDPRMSTPSPRITQGTNGATRAYLGRSCRCRWHARGACQTWDTPHSALPRRRIGNSTDGPGRQTPSACRAASANFAAECMRWFAEDLAVTCGGFARSRPAAPIPYNFRTAPGGFTTRKAKLLILLALPRGLEPLFSP